MKRFFTVILHRITAACVQLDKNRIAGILKKRQTQFKKHKKGHFWTFYNFSKTVQAIERIFEVILHHIIAPCVQLEQNRMAGV